MTAEERRSISWPWTEANWNQRRFSPLPCQSLILQNSKCRRIQMNYWGRYVSDGQLFNESSALPLLDNQSKMWSEITDKQLCYTPHGFHTVLTWGFSFLLLFSFFMFALFFFVGVKKRICFDTVTAPVLPSWNPRTKTLLNKCADRPELGTAGL